MEFAYRMFVFTFQNRFGLHGVYSLCSLLLIETKITVENHHVHINSCEKRHFACFNEIYAAAIVENFTRPPKMQTMSDMRRRIHRETEFRHMSHIFFGHFSFEYMGIQHYNYVYTTDESQSFVIAIVPHSER